MEEKQKTIARPVTVEGHGLHTGKKVTLTIKPSPAGTGIRFLRTDLGDDAFVAADARLVADTSRGTTLESNGNRVATVEHVLAALTGAGIDNAILEVNGPETPIKDGSSRFFTDAIMEAGVTEQEAFRDYFEIREPIRFYHAEKDCEITALPADDYRITCLIDFQSKVLGHQHAGIKHISEFNAEISGCRTFVFLHELEYLLANNLIKGGDLSNAIVFVDKAVSQEELDRLAKVLNKPSVEVRREGILNNLELAFHNEPARHKLLDVVGDLTLTGKPIKGHIIASKPGHASNVLFAKLLQKHIKEQVEKEQIPVYNPNIDPIYDINAIKRMLPHRYPFLLVDKIIEVTDSSVVAVKNVSMNEPFFTGHFPNEPIMPGVLQVEAMAQAGGILVLSQVDDPENYNTYFLKIDNVRFKQKVVPGDTLVFKMSLLTPVRRGICHMRGVAYVGKNVVMEAEMMALIEKNK
ncbi:MAG: bifunctional UDP-3-O-[3-hydroxymyristoyl] N-acetylglucosamine deacetylase/3-hydroxyacyl-ACP dehydratase [Bacteroidia bacterium]|nr:MAG: bifunctional UDP-3-O-[3-hydroxymyristoyl] N-acetylglucosamine deacetylase/3-hydroxyacyl-ACP dehydratase [Bacteroidia bacterium]